MTYEEFKQKATNPTHRDIPSIFQVRMITMGGPAEGKKQLYPKYTTNDYASGFATTLAEAEAMVRKDVAWWKAQEYRPGVFCYLITEKPMNMMAYDGEILSERAYDAEGKLINRTFCSSAFCYYSDYNNYTPREIQPDEIFRGRTEEEIRFHKGDIVEVLSGNEVSLAIVVGSPLSTRWVWEKTQNTQDKRGLDELIYDESDDSYTVIDGPGFEYHEHVNSMRVFAPHFHIPIRIERRFKGYLGKAEYYQKAHDCSFRNKEQLEKSEKCGCFFCGKIFSPTEITSYISTEERTAECPYCFTDSVIGDVSGFPITPHFLRNMRKKWF